MNHRHHSNRHPPELSPPLRNSYFYGKLMDVHQFRMETDYFNAKRWLVNRLVGGFGVACGVDVLPSAEKTDEILITEGVVIDKWGREIIVPPHTKPIPIPPQFLPEAKAAKKAKPSNQTKESQDYDDDQYVSVWIRYVECPVEPQPVLAGDACDAQACEAGVIREEYCIEFEKGRHKRYECECRCDDLISNGKMDYGEVARFVTRLGPKPPDDPRILLAHIRLPDGTHQCNPVHFDITVRPVVFGNDLLFDLILCALRNEDQPVRGNK